MPSDQPIRINLLTAPDEDGGNEEAPSLPGGKPLALLVYLVHHPHGVPRDELARLLWPDRLARRARGSLRQALWTIRKHLGDDIFTVQDPVQLAPGRVATDIEKLLVLIEDGRLAEAVELWSAAPFRFFPDPGSRAWSRWAEELRHVTERRFGRALLDEGRRTMGRDGPGAALPWFEAALRVEPHRRSVHEARIQALLLLNRTDEAEAALVQAGRDGGADAEAGDDPGTEQDRGEDDPTWPELGELRRQLRASRPRREELPREGGENPWDRGGSDHPGVHGDPGRRGEEGERRSGGQGADRAAASLQPEADGGPSPSSRRPVPTGDSTPSRRGGDAAGPTGDSTPSRRGDDAAGPPRGAEDTATHAQGTRNTTIPSRRTRDTDASPREPGGSVNPSAGANDPPTDPVDATRRSSSDNPHPRRRITDGPESVMEDIPLLRNQGLRDRLIARWTQAHTGNTQVMAIVGEPGIGKRSMVAEVERAARIQRATVVRLRGVRGGGEPPLTSLGRLASRLIECPGAAGTSIASEQILRRLLPSRTNNPSIFGDLTPTGDTSESHEQRTRKISGIPGLTPVAIADALVDLLGAVADENPLLLVVEEFQRMDEASRDIVTVSLRELARQPIMAVLTATPSLPAAAVGRALDQLVGDGHERLVVLERWGPPEAALLAEAMGGRVTAEEILKVGEGHPGLTMAALRSRLEAGGGVGGGPPKGSPPELPPHIRDRWLGRWERLDMGARRILGQVARSRSPVPVEAILAQDPDPQTRARLHASVDRLLAEGLLRLVPGLRVAPVHRELAALIGPRWDEEEKAIRKSGGTVVGYGPGGDPITLRRLTTGAVVVAALVLLLAVLLPMGQAESTQGAPFGGGTLFLMGLDEVVEVRPDHGPPTEWETRGFGLRVGGHHLRALPVRAGNGEIRWIARSQPGDEKPWISLISPAGVQDLYRTEGDDFPESVTPDGHRLLVRSQPMGLEGYQLNLYLTPLDLDTTLSEHASDGANGPEGNRLLIAEGTSIIRDPRMSRDGRRIAFSKKGSADTLVVTTPSGERRLTYTLPEIHNKVWCDGSNDIFLVVGRETPGDLYRLRFGDQEQQLLPLTGARLERIPTPGPAGRALDCSPDGTHLVYAAAVQGELVPIIHSLEDHSWSALPIPARSASQIIWLPEEGTVVPDRLELEGGQLPLTWGEARSLRPRLHLSDGGDAPATNVAWRSSNPSVASVAESGLVFGNGLGSARITAVWDGWLETSVEVEVRGEEGRGTLLQDPLRELNPAVWRQVGYPPARQVERDGESVVLLAGDALYWDGIMTAEDWASPRGLTAEVEFRLPLTRRDKQFFYLCLVEVQLPTHGTFERRELPKRQEACLRYPRGLLSTFDPTRGTFAVASGFPQVAVDLSASLPTDEWTHAALQMRADGTLTVLVNRTPVATSPLRLRNTADTEWRVALYGSSWETEALIRNFTLWDEPRYPVEGGSEDGNRDTEVMPDLR